jgi:hypothetical protein
MRRLLFVGTAAVLTTTALFWGHKSVADPAFERLPACQKLDVVQGTGKSVPRYIADSGFDAFAAPIVETCPQHLISLGEAWEIMVRESNRFPASMTFGRLSACEQLNAIKANNREPLPNFIARDFERFKQPVLQECPGHLKALGQAWQQINPPNATGVGPEDDFERLPECEQLRRIALDGKSLSDYIRGSGIEQFEQPIQEQCPAYLDALNSAIQENSRILFSLSVPPSSVETFEQLAPCQKLDVVDGTGKSVADYIAGSGYDQFAPDVYQFCRRHEGALEEARRTLQQ